MDFNNNYIHFEQKYREEIKYVIKSIEKHCKSKIIKKITFEYYPIQIMPNNKDHIANTYNLFNNQTIISFSYNFDHLPHDYKLLNLFHEIGHAYDLEHKNHSIMSPTQKDIKADYNHYYSKLCQKIK